MKEVKSSVSSHGTWFLAFICATSIGCATLNTSTMSPECRDLYNACLNSCQSTPQLSAAYGVGSPGSTPGPNTPSLPAGTGNEATQASCVSDCNRHANSCNVNERAATPKPEHP
jgi:hypothetical protein